jgi:hypothetical protein
MYGNEKSHPLYYCFLSPPPFKNNFNGFHYSIFICAYTVLSYGVSRRQLSILCGEYEWNLEVQAKRFHINMCRAPHSEE